VALENARATLKMPIENFQLSIVISNRLVLELLLSLEGIVSVEFTVSRVSLMAYKKCKNFARPKYRARLRFENIQMTLWPPNKTVQNNHTSVNFLPDKNIGPDFNLKTFKIVYGPQTR